MKTTLSLRARGVRLAERNGRHFELPDGPAMGPNYLSTP